MRDSSCVLRALARVDFPEQGRPQNVTSGIALSETYVFLKIVEDVDDNVLIFSKNFRTPPQLMQETTNSSPPAIEAAHSLQLHTAHNVEDSSWIQAQTFIPGLQHPII